MAEERILIIKLKQKPCDSCNVIRGCAGSCILESKWYSSMTRQKAIERMAKAIRERACEDYLHKDTDPLTSTASAIDYAKAALNAL